MFGNAVLTTMEAAMLKAREYETPFIIKNKEGEYVAVAIKDGDKAAALGSTPESATRNLIKVLVRR
jgi:hypothetical protein